MKKNSVEKISQRCDAIEACGFACGPCCVSGVIAETVFKENGKTYYFVVCAVSEGSFIMEEHLSADVSSWDYYTMQTDDEDFEEIGNYKGKAPLTTYFEEMARMCLEKMKEQEYCEETIEECEAEWLGTGPAVGRNEDEDCEDED